ncbi:serine/threonine protein kinase [Streptomyces sp. RB6PN25]|uniref:non-specific serine/threonine protein kinase n=1 Tax=Streptomyces humicola TaxID=2953240 RepID=A0ABT1PUH1_9ACTN|nr:serine/threonine-protein kinase [Streptomyces humicola]MCQ4081321.1 serine/threonine protein kinase [Streptomyces humicola]
MSGHDGPGTGSSARPSGGQDPLLVNRYRLIEQIGRGPKGIVWRAQDLAVGRDVAVKELILAGLSPEERLALYRSMQQQARAASRLKHPNVATILDVLEQDGRPWIVMELIGGPSLAEVLATQGTVPPYWAARLGLQMLSALSEAHRLGIPHGDIKPTNVLLERSGRVALSDFGLAVYGAKGCPVNDLRPSVGVVGCGCASPIRRG